MLFYPIPPLQLARDDVRDHTALHCASKYRLIPAGMHAYARTAQCSQVELGLGLCHLWAARSTTFWHDLKHDTT
jgi:hypothetical protein